MKNQKERAVLHGQVAKDYAEWLERHGLYVSPVSMNSASVSIDRIPNGDYVRYDTAVSAIVHEREQYQAASGESLYSLWVQGSGFSADKFEDLDAMSRKAWENLAKKVRLHDGEN